MINIQYIENSLSPVLFNELRLSVGWPELPSTQIEQSLKHGLYSVIADIDGKAVGMGRLVGDGYMYWYIQDLAIQPAYQHKGIGKAILEILLGYVKDHSIPNTQVTVGLMSAQGKEEFYSKYGFIARPNNVYGAGMIRYINSEEK